MSLHEKEANIAYDGRRRHLENFLKSRRLGPYHYDMSSWADEQGLCTRTAKQYWQRVVWKGLIQINGDTWKWIAEDTGPNVTEEPPETFTEYTRKEKEIRIRNELRAKLRGKM
jgi:hypothetical protein